MAADSPDLGDGTQRHHQDDVLRMVRLLHVSHLDVSNTRRSASVYPSRYSDRHTSARCGWSRQDCGPDSATYLEGKHEVLL